MVKVVYGELKGVRPQGYGEYTRTAGAGAAQGVRRTETYRQSSTEFNAYKALSNSQGLTIAENLYDSWDFLQRDFYQRVLFIETVYEYGKDPVRRVLTGKAFAIHDIMDSLLNRHQPYPAPLPFCLCAVDREGNPVTGYTLKVWSPSLRQFTYEETSDQTSCFPASALAPKYEPYCVKLGTAYYGPWTARQVHNARQLCVEGEVLVSEAYDFGTYVYAYDGHLYTYPDWSKYLGSEAGMYVRVEAEVTSGNSSGGSFVIYIWPYSSPEYGYSITGITKASFEAFLARGSNVHIESRAWSSHPQSFFIVKSWKVIGILKEGVDIQFNCREF